MKIDMSMFMYMKMPPAQEQILEQLPLEVILQIRQNYIMNVYYEILKKHFYNDNIKVVDVYLANPNLMMLTNQHFVNLFNEWIKEKHDPNSELKHSGIFELLWDVKPDPIIKEVRVEKRGKKHCKVCHVYFA